MKTRFRLLWLPSAAILLPCVFVGVLGYKWIALERETAGRRDADAAKAAASMLEEHLRAELRAVAGDTHRALVAFAAARPPFAPVGTLPGPVADAFLFSSNGTLVAPDYATRAGLATAAFQTARATAEWQSHLVRLEALENERRHADALRVVDDLLRDAPQSTLRADLLLRAARLSEALEHGDVAERYAREIVACCPDARDEFGMSFALYAAWRRSSSGRSDPASVLAELRELADRGYLGHAADATALSLLGKTLRVQPAQMGALIERITQTRARVDRHIELGRLAASWLSTVEMPRPDDAIPLVGAFRRAGSPAVVAVQPVDGDRRLVMVLDTDALATRVADWSTRRAAFDISLTHGSPDNRHPIAVLTMPLFTPTTGLQLAVHQRMGDAAIDMRRDRLFVAAIVGALALTLLIGYLAVRDVTREVATAALRSTFVAGVTHELKTPIASIRLLAETLRARRARPEANGELLDTIVEESDRLTRLVDNVLTSSRIESGVHAYHARTISVPEVVHAALRRFEYVLRQEGFSLTRQITDGELEVEADPEALERTLLNLLGNAVKYSGNNRTIRVTVGRNDGHAEIAIEDDGIGIDASEHGRVFEPFYRSPAADANTAGAGLGLALARHFVEAHQGGISVRSAPRRGSVFTIRLPLAGRHRRLASLPTTVDHGAHSHR